MGRLKILSKIITLSYPKYRVFSFIFVLIALAIIPVSFLENAPNLSICSRIFGEYCYSVGITRGVSSLLKGNLSKAIAYNFLSIPVLITMLGIIFLDIKNLIKD